MNLRPYQREASDAIFNAWQDSQAALVVMPTGLGKTILFCDVIRRVAPKRALVVAHREELIFQAQDKLRRSTGIESQVEMGQFRVDGGSLLGDSQAVISTIQTLNAGGDGRGRMGKFAPDEFGVLIIDEAHHAVADSYKRVINYFRQNEDIKILGVTATPDRADEMALGQVFETVAYDYEIQDAIQEGWLVPINQKMVNVEGLDYSTVRTTAGDLNGGDLRKILEQEEMLHRIASPSIELIGDKRALVFTAGVKQAEQLCEIFNRHRRDMAQWVCGETPKEARRDMLAGFAKGKTQVLCNCGVLTEGFDDPGVEVVIMGRPTKSRALYAQMVGRATRPLPGIVDGLPTAWFRREAITASAKPSCMVVDFVGNSGRHRLVTSAEILGGNFDDDVVERARKIAECSEDPVRMDEALLEALEQKKTELEEQRKAEEERRAKLTVGARYNVVDRSPFDVFGVTPPRERGWDRHKELSERQIECLKKGGIDPTELTYAEGKAMIGELFRRWDNKLCTFKQAKLLQKHGYNTTDLTFAEASSLITELKNNGWRRPESKPVYSLPPKRSAA